MTISIIIATKDNGICLERCLASILEQSQAPEKVIVQDGLSSDNTVDVLHRYSLLFGGILDWISEPDSGISDAWNKAIARASGDWILFLGSDDRLHSPIALARAGEALNRLDPHVRIAYGNVIMVRPDGTIVDNIGLHWSHIKEKFRRSHYCLQHQAVFHRLSFFQSYGAFDLELRICADQEILLRGLYGEDAVFLDGLNVSCMAIGGVSGQRRNIVRVNRELLSIQGKYRRVPFWDLLYWNLIKAHVIFWLYFLGGDSFALRCINFYRVVLRGRSPLSF